MGYFPKFLVLGSLFCYCWTMRLNPDEENVLIDLSTAAVEIMKHCHSEHQIVVVYEASGEGVIHSLYSLPTAKLVLNSEAAVAVPIEQRRTMPLFLMTTGSAEQLHQQLQSFKHSSWWNIMAKFFILDSSEACTSAETILKAAWKMNIVTAFFLCRGNERQVMIYSYNPYTTRVPRPWREVRQFEKRPGRWTMLSQEYFKEYQECRSLNFDRTEHLDRSIIRAVVARPHPNVVIPAVPYKSEIMDYYDHQFVTMMGKMLNATIVVQFVDRVDDKGGEIAYLKPVMNSSGDWSTCWIPLVKSPSFDISYPFIKFEYTIFTQHQGYYTPLEKIWNYYGIVTLVSLAIILAMTFLVVLLSDNRHRWSFAGFEVLRLLINTALYTKLDTLARRIFFLVIFLYFLIIHATFQGHISSFLTKDVERRNVETLEDCRDQRITTIYTNSIFSPLILDPEVIAKLSIELDPSDCLHKATKNTSIACVFPTAWSIKEAMELSLYVAKKPVGSASHSLAFRRDWPLAERFNKVLMHMENAGIFNQWSDTIYSVTKFNQTRNEELKLVTHLRKISFNMIDFAFVILGAGLLLATLVFIIEQRNCSGLVVMMNAKNLGRFVLQRRRT